MQRKRKATHLNVERFTKTNLSANTRRAYAADLKDFRYYGGKVPATPSMIVRYLVEAADWCSVSILKRRLMAIRHAHIKRDLPSPTSHPNVKAILRGIKRQKGTAQRQAAPLLRYQFRKIMISMGTTPIELRDKAMLLLGFAGAFMRSELVALNMEDLERVEEGYLVHVRRSKTDHGGCGRIVPIPKLRGSLCAVTAVERWIDFAELQRGAVFRRLSRSGTVSEHRLDAGYVSLLVKR